MTTLTNPSPVSPRPDRPRSSRPFPLVVGVILALIGLPLLLAGLGLGWALGTQRDDDGFFASPTESVSTSTAALTSGVLKLGEAGSDAGWADRNLATVRLTATAQGDAPVFVGIAARGDAEGYLADAAYDEISDVTMDPFAYELTRRGSDGTQPTPPAGEAFWVAQATGAGIQQLVWDLEPGSYTAVVMNADGTTGVDVDLAVAGRLDLLGPIALTLGLAGVVFVVTGALLVVYGAQSPGPARASGAIEPRQDDLPAPAYADTPVRLTGYQDPHLSRGLWLVKWLLAIPHYLILAVLWAVFGVLTVVAFFAILVTGRYPRGVFDLNVGILRWTWRVQFYATHALGTDRYPPFTLAETDYPAALDIAYPERLSRGLVLVKWLLALPHLIIVAVLAGSWGWVFGDDGARLAVGGLIGALTLAAGLLLLFTGRYPTPLFDLLVGLNRWSYRVIAYVGLMTDDYPPFRLDQGPSEPGSEPAAGDAVDSEDPAMR